jgi:ATP-dependent DNA helicase DinG
MVASLGRYEPRDGQLAMTEAVEAALLGGRTLLCEAGTGTGKTLAYLVPAVTSGLKVVVSTATRALQEQIFHKDIPLLQSALGLDARAVLLKGLGNYLCLRRLGELRRSPESFSHRALPMVEAWARETESGDLSEVGALREGDATWREVCSSSETRIGASCEHFEACFVTKARRAADEARLVVVNHHLFFADLAVRLAAARRGYAGASVLPAYDAVIFDEAHQLEEIATLFFGTRLSAAMLSSLCRDAERALRDARLVDPVFGVGPGAGLVGAVEACSGALFDAVSALVLGRGPADLEARVELEPSELERPPLREAWHALDEALAALALLASTSSGGGVAGASLEPLRSVAARAERARADLSSLAASEGGRVVWAEARGARAALGASPVDVGHVLAPHVFERVGSVVLTSATLTTGLRRRAEASPPRVERAAEHEPEEAGKRAPRPFHYLRSRLGIASAQADELVVASPFDTERMALLYSPRDLPEPSDASYLDAAAERTSLLLDVTGGGAFVLSTSLRAMRQLAAELRRARPELSVLVQGEAPKGALLAKFRAHGHAVLVATMSFWEGVDVPGHALRLVVIDRIPFAVPSDPLFSAKSRALVAEGRSPFVELALPGAAITLKQGFGRLLRTRDDRGIVAVLDRRLVTRPYGKVLIASLPPVTTTSSLDDVREFWRRHERELAEEAAAAPR